MKTYNPADAIKTSLNQTPAIINKYSEVLKETSLWLNYGAGRYPENVSDRFKNVNHFEPFISDEKCSQFAENTCFNKREQLSNKNYSHIVVPNVLNVLQDDVLTEVLTHLSTLKTKMIIIGVYEGNRSNVGSITKIGTWQRNEKTVNYVDKVCSIFRKEWQVNRKGTVIELLKV